MLLFKGANSHGQLCNGNQDDVLEPRKVQVPYPSIKYIKGGGGHTAVVTGIDYCLTYFIEKYVKIVHSFSCILIGRN